MWTMWLIQSFFISLDALIFLKPSVALDSRCTKPANIRSLSYMFFVSGIVLMTFNLVEWRIVFSWKCMFIWLAAWLSV